MDKFYDLDNAPHLTRFRTAYSPAVRVQTDTGKVSRTKQSFAKVCDINNIMKQYQKTGLIDHVSTYNGDYGDFTNATDYHDSMNRILQADDAFSTLPAELRSRFQNDPSQFLDFVGDPANKQAMIDMGLSKPDVSSKSSNDEASMSSSDDRSDPKAGKVSPPKSGSEQLPT